MERPKILINKEQIADYVAQLADQLREDYRSKDFLMIGILKGSFVFMADLIRALQIPLELDFIQISSYGSAKKSSGQIEIVQGLRARTEGRHIVIIEDIVDTGISLNFLLGYLAKQNPASVRICALLDKPSRRKMPVSIDYLGFTVPDKFIVGYGLDYDEQFRFLSDICIINEN